MTTQLDLSLPPAAPTAMRAVRRRRLSVFTVLAGSLALLAALLVLYPLATTWIEGYFDGPRPTASPIRAALAQPHIGAVLRNTAVLVAVSVTLAVLIGSAFAWINERTDGGLGWFTRYLPITPLLVPPIAGAVGWATLASPRAGYLNVLIRWIGSKLGVEMTQGPLNLFNWYGLVFVFTLYLVPYVYLPVAAALRNLDPALEEAARTSGSGPWKTLRDVTLPSVKPSIGAGALLATIFGLALFSVPVIIGTTAKIEVLSVRIVNLMRVYPPDVAAAIGLGTFMIVVIGGGTLLQARIIKRSRHATIRGRGSRPVTVKLRGWKLPCRLIMGGYFVVTAVLPVVGLVILSTQGFWSAKITKPSFDNYAEVLLSEGTTREALRNSIVLALMGATVGVLVAAVIVAYSQRRLGNPFARGADTSLKLPGAVSHILIGVAFITAFAGPPFGWHGTLLILLLAYIVVNMPQASVNAGAAFAQVDASLMEASRVSGRSEGGTFGRVTLPLMVPGLAAGWAMVFVLMAGDITVSSMLGGAGNPVVGYEVLQLWEYGTHPLLAALAISSSVLWTIVVLTVLKLIGSRRLGLGGS